MMRATCLVLMLIGSANLPALDVEEKLLGGLHWYGPTDGIAEGEATDVEELTAGRGVFILEHILTNTEAVGNQHDAPAAKVEHSRKVTAQGHTLIYRIQPNWSRNVPHPDDPYTLRNYAEDAAKAAEALKDYGTIWQVGNEVNLLAENKHWDGEGYNSQWQPTPEQYAEVYVAVRNAIHTVTPTHEGAKQIVLMQPVSPGNAQGLDGRFADGNEFLYRQIAAIPDHSLIDGFAIHAYAEPGGPNDGVDGWLNTIREQLMIIDGFGLGDRPVFLTEFNKHMPNSDEATVSARFIGKALDALHAWNKSEGDQWPDRPNHNIVAATWFVYPAEKGDVDAGWNAYSLQYWKDKLPADPTLNPWYAYQAALAKNIPAGRIGGGARPRSTSLWYQQERNGQEPIIKLLQQDDEIRARHLLKGRVYTDLQLYATLQIVDAERTRPSVGEANTELRIRQGSRGYSLTFYPETSERNTNQVELRVTTQWTQVGTYIAEINGGIKKGDGFKVDWRAEGRLHRIRISREGESSPFLMWEVTDDEPINVGYVGAASYNLREAHILDITIGGPRMGIDF